MRKQVGGFMEFVRKQGVVGLAVGLVLGGAVSDLVKAIVNDFVNPVLGLLLNNAKGLKDAHVTLAGAKILYGDFISTLISFMAIALVIYFVVHGLGLDRIDVKEEKREKG